MSYHDNYVKPSSTGISVINPLHEMQLKLDKIIRLVNELSTDEHADAGVVSIEYIWRIADILDGEDAK